MWLRVMKWMSETRYAEAIAQTGVRPVCGSLLLSLHIALMPILLRILVAQCKDGIVDHSFFRLGMRNCGTKISSLVKLHAQAQSFLQL
jgi:hypothetical protein